MTPLNKLIVVFHIKICVFPGLIFNLLVFAILKSKKRFMIVHKERGIFANSWTLPCSRVLCRHVTDTTASLRNLLHNNFHISATSFDWHSEILVQIGNIVFIGHIYIIYDYSPSITLKSNTINKINWINKSHILFKSLNTMSVNILNRVSDSLCSKLKQTSVDIARSVLTKLCLSYPFFVFFYVVKENGRRQTYRPGCRF